MSAGESQRQVDAVKRWAPPAVFALLVSVVSAVFGEVLLRWTHYRPLGAATLAVVTAIFVAVVWPLYGAWLAGGNPVLRLKRTGAGLAVVALGLALRAALER